MTVASIVERSIKSNFVQEQYYFVQEKLKTFELNSFITIFATRIIKKMKI